MTHPRERSVLWKFAAGVALMVTFTAGASATAGLLAIKQVADKIPQIPASLPVEPTKPGKPQTLLLLGSDRRYAERHSKGAARSDTIMLLRLDPRQEATTMLSVPRDLLSDIPGYGREKINNAYSHGGPRLTLRTVRELLGLRINHVVNVNFSGFRKAVDLVGCVYSDVDRRYHHSNAGLPAAAQYAQIDIEAGYQKLCGSDALDYVRFRHADSDLVRAARQQDFLRQASDQISSSSLIDKRGKLIDIFSKAAQTDGDLGTVAGLERLLKLALFSAGHPVRQVAFPARFVADRTSDGQPFDYVTAEPAAIQAAADRFLHGAGQERREVRRQTKRSRRHKAPNLLVKIGRQAVGRAGFPVRVPTRATPAARPSTDGSPRVYTIRDRASKRRHAYRFVFVQNLDEGQYYGVQGTDWRSPPLLAHPTSTRTVGGRRLLEFREGSRLRTVAWRTDKAAYWVSNTLGNTLTDDQMLGIAASLKPLRKGRR